MRAHRVLLVDHDVDALASLAAELRDRGIRVSLANGSQMACERAKTGAFDVVLAAREVAEPSDGAMGVIDAMSVELAKVPPLLVLVEGDSTNDTRVPRSDVDRIVARIAELARPSQRPLGSSLTPSAHGLENAPLGDLLVVLATERRSGTMSMTTPKGSGEIRIVEGDIADAVYVRLEGKKAIARMLAEREGTATFTPGAPAIMRRIHESTRAIVDEARALSKRADELRDRAGALAKNTLIAVDGISTEGLSELDQHVIARLRVPATMDELLDELPKDDASILESALKLDERGAIKQLGGGSARVQLCGADQLHLLRASAARAKPLGYDGAARLVFAATPSRLAIFTHTVLSLADAFPGNDPTPSVPVPHVVSTIRLGDGVELDIVTCPLVPAYAPLWHLALAGAAVVVRLDEAAAEALAEVCGSINVAVLDAKSVFGSFDESSAVQVASLIKTALDAES